MTFELSPEHLVARERARSFAHTLEQHAAAIDRNGAVPDAILREAAALVPDAPAALVAAIEELAAVSAAVAMRAAAANAAAEPLGLSGLRGAGVIEPSMRAQLMLTAVGLGIGRTALEAALTEIRQAMAARGAESEKPHWVLADAATELDGARLLAYKAAQTMAEADVAVARLMANAAAAKAVEAALRIAGAAALKEGSTLERLSRDVRAVALVLGTEEDQRAIAAEGLLPAP